jgi:hypothetical protein
VTLGERIGASADANKGPRMQYVNYRHLYELRDACGNGAGFFSDMKIK